MKKILLFTWIFGAATLSSTAQIRKLEGPVETLPRFSADYTQSAARAGGGSPVTASQVDTIWYEDFANGIPIGWSLSGVNSNTCPWVYSLDGSWGYYNGNNGTSGTNPIQSTSAANGFLLNDPDSANNSLYGQPSGTTYQYMETFITTDAISTVGYPAVRLEFEQFFRYNNDPELQVGVSTDGTNFTFFDARNDVSSNQASPNPMLYSIDITQWAANQPTVYIRLGWESRVYYWMIDDIRLVTPPANDLSLEQVYYNGFADSTETRYYTRIPEKHANLDTITFGAAISNIGSAVGSNARMEIEVTRDGNQVWNGSTAAANIAVAGTDSTDATAAFIPNYGTGNYSIRYEVVADSADYDSTNNILGHDFVVSDNEYWRDNNNSNQGNWYNANTNWEMLVMFEIHETDTVSAISCYFPDLTNGYGIDAGDPISYYLYASNDLQTPVASNQFYIVQAGEENDWLSLPLQPVTLSPGVYYAGFQVFEQETAIGSFTGLNEDVPPFTVLVRVDGSTGDQWSYTTTVQPFVRLLMRDPDACNGVTINVNGTVIDSTAVGSVTIDVSGGNDPYTYTWTGPSGFTSTSQNISNLTTQGVYTVVVSDLFGCESAPVPFTVAGTVSINELSSKASIRLFPNPAQDQVTILVENGQSGMYTLDLYNLQGQLIRSEKTTVSGTAQIEWNMDQLPAGIYMLTVSEPNGDRNVHRLILR